VPVIAGAGSNDTGHGVNLARSSQKHGADGLLVVTPYYNKTTQKGLIEHYSEYAKNVDIPIIIYNVPSRTGLNVEPKTALALSQIENIIAIKEASSNLEYLVNLTELINGKMDIYSGNDNEIIPVLSLGGIGVISVIANVVPREVHDLCYKYFDGDLKGALGLQLKLLPIFRAAFCEVNPIPIKTALKYLGYKGYHFRRPLTTMLPEHEELLVSELKKLNLIK
jgi:4-hydroxy-tetrahydrodipicolinate synthase